MPSSAMTTLTMTMLTVSTYILRRQMAHNSYVSGAMPANGSSFDYIIVGAGSAGCVLASRLAANANVSILLLEAGGPQSVVTDMPGNTLFLVGNEFDWNYHVVAQQSAGLAYPNFFISRGKVMGGSSTLNWDIYNRGNPMDYNNWASNYGLTNMTWSKVFEYFLLSENNTDASVRDNGYHGSSGPVSVSTETQPDPVMLNLQRLMNRVGYPTIDINAGSQLGTAIAQMYWNIDTAIKSTTANSYIETGQRSNLRIVNRAHVDRILFNSSALASGVQFQRNGTTYQMYANREVIISAGPINTPQVLMLSGIGPRDHLVSLDIPVRLDLHVGDNLHDMVFVPLYYRINNPNDIDPFPLFNNENLYNYFTNASGPLAHHPDGVTYYVTPSNPNSTWPDTFIVSIVEFANDLNGTLAEYTSNVDAWRRYWEPYYQLGYYLAVDPVLARPRSRGTVRLNSTNPRGPPLVDPRYLSDEVDFKAMMDVTRFAWNTLQKMPLPNVTRLPDIPGCPPCYFSNCEAYLECHVRSLSRSYYNFVGTARMGTRNDALAVVDPYFKVIGCDNLRVVDASVIPETPNAHTNAATIMLAEKAARLIMTGD